MWIDATPFAPAVQWVNELRGLEFCVTLGFRFERGYLGASPVNGWQELNRNAKTSSEEVEVDDVVVLATPYDAALGIAQSRGDDLGDKVVVDITNPVDWATFDRLVTPPDSPPRRRSRKSSLRVRGVVKAFNTTFAGKLVAGGVADRDLDVLVAGDDADAKNLVADLALSSGMRPVDVGLLRRAQQLEHLGFLHMALQENLRSGYGCAVKVITT